MHLPGGLADIVCLGMLFTLRAQGTDEEKAEAAAVLVSVLEAVRVVAVGLAPLTPALSRRIYSQLGFSDEHFQVRRRSLPYTRGLRGTSIHDMYGGHRDGGAGCWIRPWRLGLTPSQHQADTSSAGPPN